jgi:acyl dehydratase
MAIRYEDLMAYSIPQVHQHLSKRDTVFYALSIGLGQDPLDERQLDYIDHHRALRAMPSMAVVLGHPGFWLADPRTGVDAVKVVHGEQSILLHRALPVEGDIVGKTRVTGLVDKGAGRGALMYSEKQVTDEAGTLLATTRSTIFLRGDGGFGGPDRMNPPMPSYPAPEGNPDYTIDLATRPEQALYYRLNGDDNPLHADPSVAARAGFARPILHGLCTLGVVSHAVLAILCGSDADRLRELHLRFTSPVFPGEVIRVEMWANGAFRARVTARDIVAINNGMAVVAPKGESR